MSRGKPEGYIDVAQRIVEFRDKYPDGCLRPANLERPYDIVTAGDKTFIVVVAAAYRTPDDPTPGVGMAWEPFPGPTNFTLNSELQNAETSAWGRALVAVLAADTKEGIASADEVRSRQGGSESAGRSTSGATNNECAECSQPIAVGAPIRSLGGGKYAHKDGCP